MTYLVSSPTEQPVEVIPSTPIKKLKEKYGLTRTETVLISDELDPILFKDIWGLSRAEAALALRIEPAALDSYAFQKSSRSKRTPSARVRGSAADKHNLWILLGKKPKKPELIPNKAMKIRTITGTSCIALPPDWTPPKYQFLQQVRLLEGWGGKVRGMFGKVTGLTYNPVERFWSYEIEIDPNSPMAHFYENGDTEIVWEDNLEPLEVLCYG